MLGKVKLYSTLNLLFFVHWHIFTQIMNTNPGHTSSQWLTISQSSDSCQGVTYTHLHHVMAAVQYPEHAAACSTRLLTLSCSTASYTSGLQQEHPLSISLRLSAIMQKMQLYNRMTNLCNVIDIAHTMKINFTESFKLGGIPGGF